MTTSTLSSNQALSIHDQDDVQETCHVEDFGTKSATSTSDKDTNDLCYDIHSLFATFNERFFWGKLHGVEISWNSQMLLAAGRCDSDISTGRCLIKLSAPILNMRPHSDLVDILLHEMIHAYLFQTKAINDHGLNFHYHKDRINKKAGTNIAVYHKFNSGVKLYQQHWWRCNGACQNRSPYYGMVKRAMNRVPGPNDRWWYNHLISCGGSFIKIKEPAKHTNEQAVSTVMGSRDRSDSTHYKETTNTKEVIEKSKAPKDGLENVVDLTSAVSTSPSAAKPMIKNTKNRVSPLATIDLTNEPMQKKPKTGDKVNRTCNCPVCNKMLLRETVNEHLETCDGLHGVFDDSDITSDVNESGHLCTICNLKIKGEMKLHVDDCLNNSGIDNVFDEPTLLCSDIESPKSDSSVLFVAKINDSDFEKNPCSLVIKGNIQSHTDECLSNSGIFNEPTQLGDSISLNSSDIFNDPTLPFSGNNSGIFNEPTQLGDSISLNSSDIFNDPTLPLSGNNSGIFNEPTQLGDSISLISSDIFNDPTLPLSGNNSGIFNEPTLPFSASNSSIFNEPSTPHSGNVFPFIESFSPNLFEDNIFKSDNVKKNVNKICTICGLLIKGDMQCHIDECLNNSGIFDDPTSPIVISDDESPTGRGRETKVPKPISVDNRNAIDNKIDETLNDCDESAILISDSESPVIVFDRRINVPKPKQLNDSYVEIIGSVDAHFKSFPIRTLNEDSFPKPIANNNESEARVTCRVCGMRYGVSKFNAHVCYPNKDNL